MVSMSVVVQAFFSIGLRPVGNDLGLVGALSPILARALAPGVVGLRVATIGSLAATPLGLLARVMRAGIAGAALAPRGREQAGAVIAVAAAVPCAYLTLAGRKRSMARLGQARSGLIEDALMVAAGMAIVAMAVQSKNGW